MKPARFHTLISLSNLCPDERHAAHQKRWCRQKPGIALAQVSLPSPRRVPMWAAHTAYVPRTLCMCILMSLVRFMTLI